MAFKNNAQRGAFFEKLKQKMGSNPAPGVTSGVSTLKPISFKPAPLPKIPAIPKPFGAQQTLDKKFTKVKKFFS